MSDKTYIYKYPLNVSHHETKSKAPTKSKGQGR